MSPGEQEARCLRCDRVLTQSDEWDLGTCRECEPRPAKDWKRGDTVLNPVTGYIFTAIPDEYGDLTWLELAPAAAHSQPNPPAGAVLLVRWVDGRPLPVTDLGSGDLYAVRTIA